MVTTALLGYLLWTSHLSLAMLPSEDWLLQPLSSRATVSKQTDGSLLLGNGLVSRFFLTEPNWATVSMRSETPAAAGSQEEMLRGLAPEARLTIDCPRGHIKHTKHGRSLLSYAPEVLEGVTDPEETGSSHKSAGIAVGGVRGQKRYAFLDLTQWNITAGADDFQYVSHTIAAPTASWSWTPGQRHSAMAQWPPRGVQLRVNFRPPTHCGCFCDLTVTVVYKLYDMLPTITKWVEVASPAHVDATAPLLIKTLVTEELHVVEQLKRRVHVETDFMPRKTNWDFAQGPASDPHGGPYDGKLMNYPAWWLDPDYEDDLSDQSLHADVANTGLLLQLQYPLGPWQPVAGGETFSSFKTFMTLFDSDDEERKSLIRRTVIRTLFPQVTEAPLYFYTTDASSEGIRRVADQCNETGFEAIIISFGSGFDPSSTDPTYIARIKADVEYVHSRGLLIGGYTLMQNPPGLSGNDYCASPDGKSGYNTHIADFSTRFHQQYRSNILAFVEATGVDLLETDGPYEGATCAVTNHSGFTHQNNSQVAQFKATTEFYQELKAKSNTYLTVPDPYWMSAGTNKEPMGYTDAWNHIPTDEEGNWEYLTLGRMYLYDGTFHKPTTMGWLGFELSRTPPPMSGHELLLEAAMASFLGQGNIPCYRGPQLYDTNSSSIGNMWKLWVAHYKQYRIILMADAVHVIRPTGASIEVSLHVNASVDDSASAAAFGNFFNPTNHGITTVIRLPLYYAGFARGSLATLQWGGSLVHPTAWAVPHPSSEVVLDDFTLRLDVAMAPKSFLWVAIHRARVNSVLV